MEKKLSYEDQVKIKNLLVKVKFFADEASRVKNELYKTVDEISEILNKE